MKNYIAMLNDFVKQNKPPIKCSDVDSLLDMLYCCYHQQKSVDTPTIKTYFSQLDQVLGRLPIQLSDQVVDLACDLCSVYQKQAFREGVLAGFRLYEELHGQNTHSDTSAV